MLILLAASLRRLASLGSGPSCLNWVTYGGIQVQGVRHCCILTGYLRHMVVIIVNHRIMLLIAIQPS